MQNMNRRKEVEQTKKKFIKGLHLEMLIGGKRQEKEKSKGGNN